MLPFEDNWKRKKRTQQGFPPSKLTLKLDVVSYMRAENDSLREKLILFEKEVSQAKETAKNVTDQARDDADRLQKGDPFP
jgi:hypothetical protein